MKPLYWGLLFFGIAFIVGITGAISVPQVSIDWDPDGSQGTPYVPTRTIEEGREVVFVYMGASWCGASNIDGLPETVKALKLLLQEKAEANNRNFAAVGISVDWIVEDGIGHLGKFGVFDEVITGRNWLNTGAMKYVWKDIPGRAGTPTILVLERRIIIEEEGYTMRDERLLSRKIGTEEIRQWYERGAPLPTLLN